MEGLHASAVRGPALLAPSGIGITADSEHFLIANYHSINDCRYVIGVYRVLIFYLK
jgi:hypothetical protein